MVLLPSIVRKPANNIMGMKVVATPRLQSPGSCTTHPKCLLLSLSDIRLENAVVYQWQHQTAASLFVAGLSASPPRDEKKLIKADYVRR